MNKAKGDPNSIDYRLIELFTAWLHDKTEFRILHNNQKQIYIIRQDKNKSVSVNWEAGEIYIAMVFFSERQSPPLIV